MLVVRQAPVTSGLHAADKRLASSQGNSLGSSTSK